MLGGGELTPVWGESEPSGGEASTSRNELSLADGCEASARRSESAMMSDELNNEVSCRRGGCVCYGNRSRSGERGGKLKLKRIQLKLQSKLLTIYTSWRTCVSNEAFHGILM